jgi:hypothetical protein
VSVNVRTYGVKGDGITDDTVALQKALLGSGSGNRRDVIATKGDYLVSAPIQVGPATAFIGEGGPGTNACVKIIAKADVPWPAHRGVLETSNYNDFSGTAPFAHGTRFEGIQIDCQDRKSPTRPEYGLVFWAGGEQSLIRRVSAHNFRTAAIFCPGSHAVLQIEDSSGWQSDGYGLKFARHPDPAMPQGTQARGDARSGSVRIFGFSGDANKQGLVYADGAGVYEAAGLKSEYNNPMVHIAGEGRSGPRQRWSITGYRSQQSGMPGAHDLVRVTGSARPQVHIGAGAAYFCDQLIECVSDPTLSVRDTHDGNFVFWDPESDMHVLTKNVRLP